MKNAVKIFLAAVCVAVIVLVLLPSSVNALGIWGEGDTRVSCIDTGDPCTFCEGIKLGVNIVDFLAKMAIVITAGLIVLGGVMMMISGGNQGRFSSGKGIITAAVWGLVITILAWIIINTILVFLVKDPANKNDVIFETGISNWWKFNCVSY